MITERKIKYRKCDWCQGVGYFPNSKTAICSAMKEQRNCTHCDGKGAFLEFTEEDKQNFMRACYRTWETLASDISTVECWKETKAAVVEITLDADYMDMYGYPHGLSAEEKLKFIQRMRQIRYSKVAHKWCREAIYGR